MSDEDIRVVVGVDFGTTFSGFAYAHTLNPDSVFTNNEWPIETRTEIGRFKANTILHYNGNDPNVLRWGRGAVAKPTKNYVPCDFRVAERFKLHLADAAEKPDMPKNISPEQAIVDYLKQINMLVKKKVTKIWTNLLYPQNVRFVFTIPAGYDDIQIGKMQDLVYKAGFLESPYAQNLEIITEPEAAALCCLQKSEQYNLKKNDLYLIVDSGGGTVDLTVRKMLSSGTIGEITESTCDFAGGSYVDQEFVKFLAKKIGDEPMKKLREEYYHHLQHLIDVFCSDIKSTFQDGFESGQIELDRACPILKRLLKDTDAGEELEENGWVLELEFSQIKKFFDPCIDKIIQLIDNQLAKITSGKVTAMFLVGGFSESLYLQKRVKDKFSSRIALIATPTEPEAAIVRGAVHYGVDMTSVETRVLPFTYGTIVHRLQEPSDSPECKSKLGLVPVFHEFVKRGTRVRMNDPFTDTFYPMWPWQTCMNFEILATRKFAAKYPHEDGISEIGKMEVKIPNNDFAESCPVQFTLSFEKRLIRATALNPKTKEKTSATFDYTEYNLDS